MRRKATSDFQQNISVLLVQCNNAFDSGIFSGVNRAFLMFIVLISTFWLINCPDVRLLWSCPNHAVHAIWWGNVHTASRALRIAHGVGRSGWVWKVLMNMQCLCARYFCIIICASIVVQVWELVLFWEVLLEQNIPLFRIYLKEE